VHIVDDLQPSSHVVIVSKTQNWAFFDTNLDQLLRQRNINQIVVTGVATNCIEVTDREALTVSDATATSTPLRNGSMRLLRKHRMIRYPLRCLDSQSCLLCLSVRIDQMYAIIVTVQ
jgi:uncharacterized membrane-anchored protein